MHFADEIYTSEKRGSDEHGDGTEQKPFKTILQAMRYAGKEPFPVIYTDAKEEGKVSSNLFMSISIKYTTVVKIISYHNLRTFCGVKKSLSNQLTKNAD